MTNFKNAEDVFNRAHQLGMDLMKLRDVVAVSSGSSAVLQSVGFETDEPMGAHLQGLMRKDIEHFADAIHDRGIAASEVRDRGLSGADVSSRATAHPAARPTPT